MNEASTSRSKKIVNIQKNGNILIQFINEKKPAAQTISLLEGDENLPVVENDGFNEYDRQFYPSQLDKCRRKRKWETLRKKKSIPATVEERTDDEITCMLEILVPDLGESYCVMMKEISIGSDTTCDIYFNDESSPPEKFCVITIDSRKKAFVDPVAKNLPVFLNGYMIKRCQILKGEDIITASKLALKFYYPSYYKNRKPSATTSNMTQTDMRSEQTLPTLEDNLHNNRQPPKILRNAILQNKKTKNHEHQLEIPQAKKFCTFKNNGTISLDRNIPEESAFIVDCEAKLPYTHISHPDNMNINIQIDNQEDTDSNSEAQESSESSFESGPKRFSNRYAMDSDSEESDSDDIDENSETSDSETSDSGTSDASENFAEMKISPALARFLAENKRRM